ARVRFIAAQTLGVLVSEAAADALQGILIRDYAYRWSRLGVFASLPPTHTRRVAAGVLSHSDFNSTTNSARLETLEELAELWGARSAITPADVSWLIEHLLPEHSAPARIALMDGLARGLERS